MGLRGAPKKPEHLRVLAGTIRPQKSESARLAFKPLPFVPLEWLEPPPDWMTNKSARDEWNRLGNLLIKSRMLNEASLTALGHLCAMHGVMVDLYAKGEMPTQGQITNHTRLLGQFGLTPASAQSLKTAPEAPERVNSFKTNGRRDRPA